MESLQLMAGEGRGSSAGSSSRVWTRWAGHIAERLTALREGTWKPTGSQTKTLRLIGETMALDSDVLAVLACSQVLNLLLLPGFRNKQDVGIVPYVTVVVAVGDSVLQEEVWRMMAKR